MFAFLSKCMTAWQALLAYFFAFLLSTSRSFPNISRYCQSIWKCLKLKLNWITLLFSVVLYVILIMNHTHLMHFKYCNCVKVINLEFFSEFLRIVPFYNLTRWPLIAINNFTIFVNVCNTIAVVLSRILLLIVI